MWSTHACTPSFFAPFFSQYSRRLLSILAQPASKYNVTKQSCCDAGSIYSVVTLYIMLFTKLHSCAQKIKKNSEHTHMYTILSQLSYPIFTVVVVYSRTTIHNINNKHGCDIISTHELLLIARSITSFI